MATEHADYFEEILREAELARVGKQVSGYREFFSGLDNSLMPLQQGDREPSDGELFYNLVRTN